MLASATGARGQEYHVRNWHVEDGLPTGQITAIAQTAAGYLWLGTPGGLVCFDGCRFKVFTADATPGLGDSRICSLLTDQAGTLWVGTMDGNLVRKRGDGFEAVGEDGAASRPLLAAKYWHSRKINWACPVDVPGCGYNVFVAGTGRRLTALMLM